MLFIKQSLFGQNAESPEPLPAGRTATLKAPGGVRFNKILGVDFDCVTFPGAMERIEQMIAHRGPHYVVTANVDFLVQAHRDAEFSRILAGADLVLCDGTPLVWASRLLGRPLPERVAGSDLVPRLIERAAEKKYRLFFLGAAPEAASLATANVRARYPNLHVDFYSPPFRPLDQMNHDEIRERIRLARPDILFVAFGCPKAEKWMAMNLRLLDVPVMMGIGGTIDFLAGRVKRAPVWIQRAGLEWAFRLAQEPRRLVRRYATDFLYFGRVLARELCARKWQSWRRLHKPGTLGSSS